MTACEIHPESLFDALRAGRATKDDLQRLRVAAKGCVVCRVELIEASAALQESYDVSPALANAHAQRAMAALFPASGKDVYALRRPEKNRLRMRNVSAIALILFASSAVAAVTAYVVTRSPIDQSARPPAPGRPSGKPAVSLVSTKQPAQLMASIEARDDVSPPFPSRVNDAGPETMLRRANLARRQGHSKMASKLYRQLIVQHPLSREAMSAHVFHGRLLLDRLGQPAAALVAFRTYLSSAQRGTLTEDALVGQALALERLGRRSAARAAWQRILATSPSSVSALRAKAALTALSDDAEP